MARTTTGRLYELFKIVKQQAIESNFPIGEIAPNLKMTNAKSFWGRCDKTLKNGKPIFEIEISQQLLYAEEIEILTTLMHEVLHTCDGCDNHGEKWKHYAAIANKKYGYHIQTKTSSDTKYKDATYLPKASYCVQCKKCGKNYEFQRKAKIVLYPELYRCKCGGNLIRIK